MHIENDGDIVRGLGFVTLYAAYLEEQIDNLLFMLDPVEKYEPNGFGLYDMGGNVWEWVSDRYSETYYHESEYDNPTGPTGGNNRVIRSGSWHSGAMCKKVYYRKGLPFNWCDFAVGFRCVNDLNKKRK